MLFNSEIVLDGTHYNYMDKYEEPIIIRNITEDDIKDFKGVIRKLNESFNAFFSVYYDQEYEYHYVVYSSDDPKCDPYNDEFVSKIRNIIEQEKLFFE